MKEKLKTLIGQTVTVTRTDLPGTVTGVLEAVFEGHVAVSSRVGSRELIPLKWVGSVVGDRWVGDVTPSRYQWAYKGVSFDFYRLCEILGVRHHAQAHALKKVIRAGQSVKSLETDIEEAIACLTRWKEMVGEDK